jgi:hypothetical protein
MLYRPNGDDGEFKGVVYVEGKRAHELPALGLIPNQFAVEVKSVFFENAAGGSRPELFILYSYHRNGSQSDDGHACAIYQWRDNQFVRLPAEEKKVVNLATASAVRQRLRQATTNPNPPTPGGPKK